MCDLGLLSLIKICKNSIDRGCQKDILCFLGKRTLHLLFPFFSLLKIRRKHAFGKSGGKVSVRTKSN